MIQKNAPSYVEIPNAESINYTWSSNLKFVFTIDKNNSFTLSLISPSSCTSTKLHLTLTLGTPSP